MGPRNGTRVRPLMGHAPYPRRLRRPCPARAHRHRHNRGRGRASADCADRLRVDGSVLSDVVELAFTVAHRLAVVWSPRLWCLLHHSLVALGPGLRKRTCVITPAPVRSGSCLESAGGLRRMTSSRRALNGRFLLVLSVGLMLTAATLYAGGWRFSERLIIDPATKPQVSSVCGIAKATGLVVPDDCADRLAWR